MRPFVYDRADSPEAATRLAAVPADAHVRAPVQFLAGGTTLLDLMKLDVMRPDRLVDINPLADTAGRADRRSASAACVWARWSAWPTRPATRRCSATIPVVGAGAAAGGEPAAPQHGEPRRQRAPAHPLPLLPRHVLAAVQQARAGLGLRRARRRQPAARDPGHQRPVHRELPRRLRAGADRARRDGRGGGPARDEDPALLGPAPAARRDAADRDHAGARRADHRADGAGGPVDAALALPEGARPRSPTSSRSPRRRWRSTSTATG